MKIVQTNSEEKNEFSREAISYSSNTIMSYSNKKKYNFSITKGSLLLDELRLLINQLMSSNGIALEELNFDVLPQNSESAKNTIGKEIVNRLTSVSWSELIVNFLDFPEHDQKLIALFLAANYHEILQDCLIEVYHKNWLALNDSLTRDDIGYWIDEKANQRPELLEIKDYTMKKVVQVLYRCLYESGIVENEQIESVVMSQDLIQLFLDKGEKWFLDVTHQNIEEYG